MGGLGWGGAGVARGLWRVQWKGQPLWQRRVLPEWVHPVIGVVVQPGPPAWLSCGRALAMAVLVGTGPL